LFVRLSIVVIILAEHHISDIKFIEFIVVVYGIRNPDELDRGLVRINLSTVGCERRRLVLYEIRNLVLCGGLQPEPILSLGIEFQDPLPIGLA
jgi:hypothetical protein